MAPKGALLNVSITCFTVTTIIFMFFLDVLYYETGLANSHLDLLIIF